MKKLLYLAVIFQILSCGNVKPSGKTLTKDIAISPFQNLDLKGKFRVFFVKSAKNFVTIETNTNFADNLKIKVDDKTLIIKEKRPTKGLDLYNITIYSVYNLDKILLQDSIEFNTSSQIKTDNFKLNLKNYAKFIGALNSRNAEIEMKDHSKANVLGFTKKAQLKISDTASFISPYWKLNTLEIVSDNENYTEVNVLDTLKGAINNTSTFIYYNDPIRAFKIAKTAKVQNKTLE